jgi:hypothetical protein
MRMVTCVVLAAVFLSVLLIVGNVAAQTPTVVLKLACINSKGERVGTEEVSFSSPQGCEAAKAATREAQRGRDFCTHNMANQRYGPKDRKTGGAEWLPTNTCR